MRSELRLLTGGLRPAPCWLLEAIIPFLRRYSPLDVPPFVPHHRLPPWGALRVLRVRCACCGAAGVANFGAAACLQGFAGAAGVAACADAARRSSAPRSKTRGLGAGRKLMTRRREQRWHDKEYCKQHLGSEWKKPFAGTSHSKGIVLEKMCVPARRAAGAAAAGEPRAGKPAEACF